MQCTRKWWYGNWWYTTVTPCWSSMVVKEKYSVKNEQWNEFLVFLQDKKMFGPNVLNWTARLTCLIYVVFLIIFILPCKEGKQVITQWPIKIKGQKGKLIAWKDQSFYRYLWHIPQFNNNFQWSRYNQISYL